MPVSDLLFEIGCEEIPAKMLARALEDLPAFTSQQLAIHRIHYAAIRAVGTPRRLAVIVKGVEERQHDVREEIVGPPVSAAFAPDGSLTKAGQGFAAKNGVDASAVAKKEVAGKKGLYAVATRELVGQDVRGLLPGVLTAIATGLKWPKSMRWGWTETTFVRPVQWLVALFGGEVVPVMWAGHTAGRASRGHRFLANHAVEIANADRYEHALREAHVVVDPIARRTAIQAALVNVGVRVRLDAALLDEVANLGEYPVAVSGNFDPSFLDVPEEVLVTAMRTHQRYFATEDAAGKLTPHFVTIAATVVKDPQVVAKGNETVLAARLSDARFFFSEDLKKQGFDAWNARLDGVVFQAKLPESARTIGAKVRRIVKIVEALKGSETARRAASICKADLASHVVGEFPEFQGVMGRRYAERFGESRAVADAIEQHWWPKGQGAELPKSLEAQTLAIADRMDTLVGCFATGLVPTGGADPLGLRRAALGVLQIEIASNHAWATSALVDVACRAYGDTLPVTPASKTQLDEFFRQRLKGLLVDDHEIDPQVAEVTLGASADDPSDALTRAKAMSVLSAGTRAVFKRIGNILDDAKAKGFGAQAAPAPDKFVASVERELHAAHAAHAAAIAANIAGGRYAEAFSALGSMEQVLAAFFDKGGVMVMDPDAALRENRLALLRAIYEPFAKIGDFRKLGATS